MLGDALMRTVEWRLVSDFVGDAPHLHAIDGGRLTATTEDALRGLAQFTGVGTPSFPDGSIRVFDGADKATE